ncbi:hypothetical protein HMI54_001306 [Coelomomyces lativittatus]|nr:hypothetical protein HMI55_001981 [Coelomomyces lativittatus]KAJ1510842.1 hypothetical protein HMI54_001306 [Coelomomyces lativittatus]
MHLDFMSVHNPHGSDGHSTPPQKLRESKSYVSLNSFAYPALVKPHNQIPIPFPNLPQLDSRSPSLVVEDLIRKVIQSDEPSATKGQETNLTQPTS